MFFNNFTKILKVASTVSDTPYRQDPNLGEDKDGLLGPEKDKYKVCSLLDKAHFCQTLRYQNWGKGLVWHHVNIDAMASSYNDYKRNNLVAPAFDRNNTVLINYILCNLNRLWGFNTKQWLLYDL